MGDKDPSKCFNQEYHMTGRNRRGFPDNMEGGRGEDWAL